MHARLTEGIYFFSVFFIDIFIVWPFHVLWFWKGTDLSPEVWTFLKYSIGEKD